MACTVQGIVDDLRCEIEDPVGDSGDGCIWKTSFLKDTIQQAATHIMGLRSDLFPDEPRTLTLTAGECYQSFCDKQCKELLEIISIDGNSCALPDPESSQDNLNQLSQCFPDDDCSAGANGSTEPYTPASYKITNACGVLFSEAPKTAVEIVVVCAKEIDWCADEIELPEILCGKLYEGFKHLILSKIYATDRKAPNLLELSKHHYKLWQDFRDWLFRVDFAKRQQDWYLYRQITSDRSD